MKKLRKITRTSVRFSCVPAEISMLYLQNTSYKRCRLSQLVPSTSVTNVWRMLSTLYCHLLVSATPKGFGSEIGFIDHFNTLLVTSLNYIAIADFHTLSKSLAQTLFLPW
jgi:hypothetical protein